MEKKQLKILIENANRRGRNRIAPKIAIPSALERKLLEIARNFFSIYENQVKNFLLPALEPATEEAETQVRLDSWVDDLLKSLEVSINVYTPEQIARLEREIADLSDDIAVFNQRSVKRAVKSSLGVDIALNEPWLTDELRAWSAQNLTLIKSIPEQAHEQVSRLALDGVRTGRNVRDIETDLVKQLGVAENRAKTIARTEVSKLNSELTKRRQQSLGIDAYYWRSSRDEKVRTNHEVLDGKLCRYDDPTIYSDDGGETWKQRSSIGGVEVHPGEDFNCRCDAAPATDLLLEELGI